MYSHSFVALAIYYTRPVSHLHRRIAIMGLGKVSTTKNHTHSPRIQHRCPMWRGALYPDPTEPWNSGSLTSMIRPNYFHQSFLVYLGCLFGNTAISITFWLHDAAEVVGITMVL